MFNKEFLKTLTVMYVEDDDDIRESLGEILKKVFKEVIICVDGQDGVDRFKFYKNDLENEIDVIISDINMPNLSGLEMLAQIRKIDTDIPAILTTAHGESNFLMEAIKANVSYYAMKPINTQLLLENVQKFCMIKHHQKLIERKEQKLSSYMNIIDNVATITKIDKSSNFTEVNELFCEVSGYSKDELIGKNIKDTTHVDILPTVYENMQEALTEGNNWEGTYKSIDKNGDTFYLRMFAIPEFDDNSQEMNGCVFIGFVTTEDERDKRDTMQKVRHNIIEQKKKETELRNRIKELELETQQNSNISNNFNAEQNFMKETLEKVKDKNAKLLSQITYYEKDIANLENRLTNIVETEKTKRQELIDVNKELKNANETLKTKLIHAQNQLNHLEKKS